MFFHIMFCVEKFIQHCLGLVRTYVHYRFSIISTRPAGLPNRRDHGSLSRNRPRLSVAVYVFRKKHFYTWCAGLIVHVLLTVYSKHPANRINSTAQECPISLLMRFSCLHPSAIDLLSIEGSLLFFTCLSFTIFAT